MVKGTTWDKATGTVTVPPRTVAVLVEKPTRPRPRPRLVGLGPRLVELAPQLTRRPLDGPGTSVAGPSLLSGTLDAMGSRYEAKLAPDREITVMLTLTS